jgi:hypothetical protein
MTPQMIQHLTIDALEAEIARLIFGHSVEFWEKRTSEPNPCCAQSKKEIS